MAIHATVTPKAKPEVKAKIEPKVKPVVTPQEIKESKEKKEVKDIKGEFTRELEISVISRTSKNVCFYISKKTVNANIFMPFYGSSFKHNDITISCNKDYNRAVVTDAKEFIIPDEGNGGVINCPAEFFDNLQDAVAEYNNVFKKDNNN